MNKNLIEQIIPNADRNHRDNFSNISLLDKLTNNEWIYVEGELIKLLHEFPEDNLIYETLVYKQSTKCLSVMYENLINCKCEFSKLMIASNIFSINQDVDMIKIGIKSFNNFDKTDGYYNYKLISAFTFLKAFNNKETNDIILKFIQYNDSLVSFNANRLLGFPSQ
ncbi:MAG: hypothetical protein KAY50_08175 [Chitinophagaceae bacterium]|nr:hypothetical protein [Chitinophagaceae bacterium]